MLEKCDENQIKKGPLINEAIRKHLPAILNALAARTAAAADSVGKISSASSADSLLAESIAPDSSKSAAGKIRKPRSER